MKTNTNTSGMNFEAAVTTTELSEAELEKATGGNGADKVNHSDLSIVKLSDAASPKLACANGSHFKEATLFIR